MRRKTREKKKKRRKRRKRNAAQQTRIQTDPYTSVLISATHTVDFVFLCERVAINCVTSEGILRFFIIPSLSKLHNIISVLCNRQSTTEWPSVIFPEESSRFSSRFVSLSGNEGFDREGRVSNISLVYLLFFLRCIDWACLYMLLVCLDSYCFFFC